MTCNAGASLGTVARDVWGEWKQFLAYLALCTLIIAVTVVLIPTSIPDFQRFFGTPHPLMVVVTAALLGGGALRLLQARDWAEITKGSVTVRGIRLSAGLATVFAVVIVIADVVLRYPEGINVPLPQAALFYPVVGFVAEIVFHVLPFTLLMLILSPLRGRLTDGKRIGISIALTALAEPTFQISFAGGPLTWIDAYTWIHVFSISLLQLYVFRRYDFVSMYAFRLIYYAYWHVLWGAIRLPLFFH